MQEENKTAQNWKGYLLTFHIFVNVLLRRDCSLLFLPLAYIFPFQFFQQFWILHLYLVILSLFLFLYFHTSERKRCSTVWGIAVPTSGLPLACINDFPAWAESHVTPPSPSFLATFTVLSPTKNMELLTRKNNIMCNLFVSETVFLPMVRMTFSRNQIGRYKALTSSRWGGVILQWMKMDEN